MTDNKLVNYVKKKQAQILFGRDDSPSEIPVSKPFLPSINRYQNFVQEIFEREWLTNNGTNVQEFELKFSTRLGTYPLIYVGNGTLALQVAIAALELSGEVITTPFSFVATVSSIVWQGCKPVFVDIEEDTFNINAELIEEKITEKTSAILVPHVFGNPCDIERIQDVADKHGLFVIYDAAHCFGTRFRGNSVLNYGDFSTISFHATKLFHTTEGGGVFSPSSELTQKVQKIRNFGFNGENNFEELGINAKNSEFHAAMGLCNLEYVDEILERRKTLFSMYESELDGLDLKRQKINAEAEYNYAYYPLVFKSESQLLLVKQSLAQQGIHSRRYFYPSLNKLPYCESEKLPVGESISSRILCLPLFHSLDKKDLKRISHVVREFTS